jgi:hypothetical protein
MSSNGIAAAGELFPVFESLAKQKSVLTLSNSYHGIEWFQDSRILEINHEYAILKVKDCKSFSVPGEQIRLHDMAFSRPVKATLRDMDNDNGLLYLSGLELSDRDWQARFHERVQPKDPTYAILCFNRRCTRAFIENISLNGQGLLIDQRFVDASRVKRWSKVNLKFKLPPNYEWNNLKGSIVNINPINHSLSRLGLRLHPASQDSRSLINYVTSRKREILEEHEQAGFEEAKSHGIEALYF